jgi:hypothetical protein
VAVFRWMLGGVAAAVLVACGGGGGDSGGTAAGSGTTAASPLALTASNYVAAGQEVLSTSSVVQVSASLVTGVETANSAALLQFAQSKLDKLPAWFRDTPATVTGAVYTGVEACSGGGSMAYTLEDQGQLNVFDRGDSVTVRATNCRESGSVVNGTLVMTANSVTGTYGVPPYAATVLVSYSNLASVASAGSMTFNGATAMSLNVPSITSVYTVTMQTNPSLNLTGNWGSTPYSSTLSNLNSSLTQNFVNGGSYYEAMEGSGTVVSSSLGTQSLAFVVAQPFTRWLSDSYPHSGQMVLTGANGSKVRITAQSNTQVLIELDADGNGIYETATNRAWSSLL